MLEAVINSFRRHVDATAIARDALRKGIIPEKVKNDVLDAKTQDDANDFLFRHLCSQATLEDLRKLCNIMKEAKGYSKMNAFGEKLQAELDKVCAATSFYFLRLCAI